MQLTAKILLRILTCASLFWLQNGFAQTCNTPGQNPETAFPVCGTASFSQSSVNLCGGRRVPNPKCPNSPLTDVNPYWYRFTCFETGTLGFTITPNSANSDYDWQVFDITGRAPGDVFTDASLTIACNWSQFFGNTGTSANAANLLECEGTVPQFSRLPTITKGRTYLLLVSHFTNTQAGYKLDFGGGTALITDTTIAKPLVASSFCDKQTIGLKLNKRMLCSSLAADGSDFAIAGNPSSFVKASGLGCATGFDFDTLVLTTATSLPNGNYQLVSKPGTDGNTLFDLCATPLQSGLSVPFVVVEPNPATIRFADTIGCAPGSIRVAFSDPLLCSTIAADGSDFVISGPQAGLSVTGVSSTCTNDSSTFFTLQLNTPIVSGGTYTITHTNGSDGNSSVSVCGLSSNVSGFTITVAEKVNANFSVAINSSCQADTVTLTHPGYSGTSTAYNYRWYDGLQRNGPNTSRTFTEPGSYQVSMVVDNGICKDSTSQTINLTATRVKASFVAPIFACPGDSVLLIDSSAGPVVAWQWEFGDGARATGEIPVQHIYQPTAQLSRYTARLTVSDANGCTSTATKTIEVPNNCFIAVPGAFTPNGDGLNDFLYPLNAYKATQLQFRVYNRYGQLVWETADWTRKWNGTINGVPQPTGTFVWHLHYELDGRKIDQRGTTVLIR